MTWRALVLLSWVGCSTTSTGPLGIDASGDDVDAPRSPDAKLSADAPSSPDAAAGTPDAPKPDAATGTPDAASTTPDAATSPDAAPITSCFTAPGATEVTSSTLYWAETYAGAQDVYSFSSNQCSDMPDSAERIYTFELASPVEWYADTRCGSGSTWDCELVLTRDGCADANVVDCETTADNETMKGILQPGQYALFIEGDDPEDPAVYDLMINFHHTEGQANCASTTLDVIDPAHCENPAFGAPRYHINFDGVTTPEDLDDFFVEGKDQCTHDDKHIGGAPDKVYKLVLAKSSEVIVELDTDWDAMLYVTGAPCGAASQVKACSDDTFGVESFDLTLGAGTWYIVVDGFGEKTFDAAAWGAFNMDVRVYDDDCE